MIHNPEDFRLASYSYLANVYSLLISALISMLKVQLTQNDAVFVLVAAVSPATLYLWLTAIHALFRGLPNRIARKLPNKHEQILLVALSFISFALWISIFGLIVGPTNDSNGVKFSQPGCAVPYGPKQLAALLWSSQLLSQSYTAGAVIFGIAMYLKWRPQPVSFSRDQYTLAFYLAFAIILISTNIISDDLISWTRTTLMTNFKSLGVDSYRVHILLLIMQIPMIDYFSDMSGWQSFNTGSLKMIERVIIDVICGSLCMLLIWMGPYGFPSVTKILTRSLGSVLVGGVILSHVMSPFPYSVLDLVNVGCWSAMWWKSIGDRLVGQSRGEIVFQRAW
jgi:hypothetical protein